MPRRNTPRRRRNPAHYYAPYTDAELADMSIMALERRLHTESNALNQRPLGTLPHHLEHRSEVDAAYRVQQLRAELLRRGVPEGYLKLRANGRRKNAVYTGKSKQVSTDIGGNRVLVDAFYAKLNEVLRPEDEIEIIPLDQVNPTHSLQEQLFIVLDYCVRKILPEITSLFRWGNEFTPRLRALAPIVDRKTAEAAYDAVYAAYDAAYRGFGGGVGGGVYAEVAAAALLCFSSGETARGSVIARNRAATAARCIYYALVTCIEAGDEAAYDRIIALTNEMLESL